MKSIIRKQTFYYSLITLLFISSCGTKDVLKPYAKTPSFPNDPDDAAVWIHPTQTDKSLVFINDKNENGGVFGFDVLGNSITNGKLENLKRPNNLDIIQNIRIGKNEMELKGLDLLFVTERLTKSIKILKVPELSDAFNRKFPVFEFDSTMPLDWQSPMGVCVSTTPNRDTVNVFVTRKSGPLKGYVAQYQLFASLENEIHWNLVQKIGLFSGKKEIESIAYNKLTNELIYSDEQYCARSYNLRTLQNDSFGFGNFKSDIEGICIINTMSEIYPNGLICISDQQRQRINFFDGQSKQFYGWTRIEANETDGIEFLPVISNSAPMGTLLVMNDKQKNFHYYSVKGLLEKMQKSKK
jgi:3-phytase